MHKFIATELQLMVDTIIVRSMSYPTYSMEVILASVVVIVQLLLCVEIEISISRTYDRTNAKRWNKNSVNGDPFQISDYGRCDSFMFPGLPQLLQRNPEMLSKINYGTIRRMGMMHNDMSDFIRLNPKGDSISGNTYFSEREKRAEFLLSITPSQYIQKDRERLNQKGLRSCIESLATNLEKAIINDSIEIQSVVKDAVKRSLNTLKDNIEADKNSNFQLTNFPSPSLQILIDQIEDKKALENSLSPDLISSIYVAPEVRSSIKNNIGSGVTKHKSEIEIREIKSCNLSIKSSKSLSDIVDIQDDIVEKHKERMVIS
ncbi:unnamed protein product [Ceutorhynchus assimilis]|uniref:Uncharacterized protein n=1 Tax=Ceutorhynchus assimilis TaxID=467358 RepID=A0A9N9MJQ3_9CUCU|nr:unnamed protein product [Ceutorhynchus assimilis]